MKAQPTHSLFLFIAMLCFSEWAFAGSASGEVKLDNMEFTVVDAVALHSHGEIGISLTDVAFDKEKMREDGKVDIFDRMRHSGQSLTINIADGKPTMCVDFAYKKGDTSSSGSDCKPSFNGTVEITQLDDARVAGSMDWEGDDGHKIKVSFDAAIEPDGK